MMSVRSAASMLGFSGCILAAAGAYGAARAVISDRAREATVMVKAHLDGGDGQPVATATGTGFFVTPRHVLTCDHVTRIPSRAGALRDADRVLVEIDQGRMIEASVLVRDRARDLALLRLPGDASAEMSLKVSPFKLRAGDGMTIVGDFPDAVRVTRGKLRAPSFGDGFAMGDAKVRSGFSGGPVLSADGEVQGILSQRDQDNNSIFVRSDAILAMLRRKGITTGGDGAVAAGGPETDRAGAGYSDPGDAGAMPKPGPEDLAARAGSAPLTPDYERPGGPTGKTRAVTGRKGGGAGALELTVAPKRAGDGPEDTRQKAAGSEPVQAASARNFNRDPGPVALPLAPVGLVSRDARKVAAVDRRGESAGVKDVKPIAAPAFRAPESLEDGPVVSADSDLGAGEAPLVIALPVRPDAD